MLLLAALLSLSIPARSDPACWAELSFAAGNRFASASSTVEYRRTRADSPEGRLENPAGIAVLKPRSHDVGLIRTRFAAMRSHGQLDIWFDPVTGAALQARRLGFGRDSRLKTWRFMSDGVWRERRAPPQGGPASTDPATWELRSAAPVRYPAPWQGKPVITPVMLIAEAAALGMRDTPGKATRWVFTDAQLYRVVLHSRPDEALDLSFTLTRGEESRAHSGERTVRRVDIRPHLQGDAPEDEPFTLLELDGEIAVFVDRETGLPARIQGTWMKVGVVPVDLAAATVDAGCKR